MTATETETNINTIETTGVDMTETNTNTIEITGVETMTQH